VSPRAPRWARPAALAVALGLAAGCAPLPRLVPLPAEQVRIDPEAGTAAIAAGDVDLAIRVSAWRGNPPDLPGYVIPLLVELANRAPEPIRYEYSSFRLLDDQRFQYTALAPVDVERILRARAETPVRLAATSSPPPILRRQVTPPADWGAPWYPYGWPWAYPYGWPWYAPQRLEDIYLQALPVGDVEPDARVSGFVYFPHLRAAASRLAFEFRYRLGDAPRALTLPFGVERDDRPAPGGG